MKKLLVVLVLLGVGGSFVPKIDAGCACCKDCCSKFCCCAKCSGECWGKFCCTFCTQFFVRAGVPVGVAVASTALGGIGVGVLVAGLPALVTAFVNSIKAAVEAVSDMKLPEAEAVNVLPQLGTGLEAIPEGITGLLGELSGGEKDEVLGLLQAALGIESPKDEDRDAVITEELEKLIIGTGLEDIIADDKFGPDQLAQLELLLGPDGGAKIDPLKIIGGKPLPPEQANLFEMLKKEKAALVDRGMKLSVQNVEKCDGGFIAKRKKK
ncbi:hypothetical protein HOD08_00365 [bacterium]|nr:hypothetical protein [bacterium]